MQNGKLGRIAIAWVGIDDHLHSGSVRLVFLVCRGLVDIRVEIMQPGVFTPFYVVCDVFVGLVV
jgi:hypothetical protein